MADLGPLLAQIPRPPAPSRLAFGAALRAKLRAWMALALVAGAVLALVVLGPEHGLRLDARGVAGGTVLLFLASFVVLYGRQLRVRRLLRANNEAMILPAANRLPEAAARYEELVRRGRGLVPYHALFVGNRGAIAFHQGDLERARVLLAEALRSGLFTQGEDGTGAYFAAMLGRTLAQQGQLADAATCRQVASALAPPGRRGMVRVLDALLLLRSGHAAAAANQLASGWMGLEGELSAHERRLLRAVHAFALSQTPGHADEVERVLAALHPPMPQLLRAVCAGWPEMERFLGAHQLLN